MAEPCIADSGGDETCQTVMFKCNRNQIEVMAVERSLRLPFSKTISGIVTLVMPGKHISGEAACEFRLSVSRNWS